MSWLNRSELLLGKKGVETLQRSNVLIVGLGGVGAYAAEQLCRSGIGKLTIVDADVIEESNLNRQLPALTSTIGKSKVDVLQNRLLDINPDIEITAIKTFLRDEKTAKILMAQQYDYVVDAIDTLSPKVFLIYECVKHKINVVSSMGAGGKTDPTMVKISDVSKSFNCKLARMMRKRLSKLGIKKGFKVVFSPEEVLLDAVKIEESQNKKSTVGTISYMPAIFGCFAASVVINDLLKNS